MGDIISSEHKERLKRLNKLKDSGKVESKEFQDLQNEIIKNSVSIVTKTASENKSEDDNQAK